jgi:hypothetical protein
MKAMMVQAVRQGVDVDDSHDSSSLQLGVLDIEPY